MCASCGWHRPLLGSEYVRASSVSEARTTSEITSFQRRANAQVSLGDTASLYCRRRRRKLRAPKERSHLVLGIQCVQPAAEQRNEQHWRHQQRPSKPTAQQHSPAHSILLCRVSAGDEGCGALQEWIGHSRGGGTTEDGGLCNGLYGGVHVRDLWHRTRSNPLIEFASGSRKRVRATVTTTL